MFLRSLVIFAGLACMHDLASLPCAEANHTRSLHTCTRLAITSDVVLAYLHYSFIKLDRRVLTMDL